MLWLFIKSTTGDHAGGFSPSPLLQSPATNALPGLKGLGGPDPHAARDAHHEQHENFDHENLHRRNRVAHGAVQVFGLGVHLAFPLHGQDFPVIHIEPLVKITRDDAGGGHRVQDGEHPDPDHEFLQFVCILPTGFHHFPDVEESHKPREDEGGTYDEIASQRDQDKTSQGIHIHASHIA